MGIEVNNLLSATNRDEFRKWLSNHYATEKECWVVVKRGEPKNDSTFWYIDAVEEAMCFGWIDSTTKRLENGITAQKFAPRKSNSLWSELNKERCRRMEKLGKMTDAGRAVLPDMSPNGFVIDERILKSLKSDKTVWDNFMSFPPLYRRVRIDTIQIKKKQSKLFNSRLQKFIENTRQGLMFGKWNDNGRLIVKKLTEMTLDELWQLFPIFLTEHQPCWIEWYNEEVAQLKTLLPSYVEYHHIGSTAVNGIMAKSIIDIIIETNTDSQLKEVAEILHSQGYIVMSSSENRISLNKGYTEYGFAEKVFHLHIRLKGDIDEVYFRDYLNAHPDVAEEYEQLKLRLWKEYEHNRDAYTNSKTQFVNKYTQLAKQEI